MKTVSRAVRVLGALGAMSFVGACAQILGVPTDPAEVEGKVAIFCSCTALSAQGDEFATHCSESLTDDFDYLGAAEAGCTRCPTDASEAQFLSDCYATITGAGAPTQACDQNVDCDSFACCGTDIVAAVVPGMSGDGSSLTLIHTDACCDGTQTCKGCASLAALEIDPTNPGLSGCAESVDEFTAMMRCLFDARDVDGAMAQCGGMCAKVAIKTLTVNCTNCLISNYGGSCTAELAACQADPDRPIATPGTP